MLVLKFHRNAKYVRPLANIPSSVLFIYSKKFDAGSWVVSYGMFLSSSLLSCKDLKVVEPHLEANFLFQPSLQSTKLALCTTSWCWRVFPKACYVFKMRKRTLYEDFRVLALTANHSILSPLSSTFVAIFFSIFV